MVGDEKAATVGTPLVDGAVVTATVLEQARADKIVVFKKKRRKNYRREDIGMIFFKPTRKAYFKREWMKW
jgi:ribosomal protein L21